MTRLRGEHNLDDVSGTLTGGFNAVLLARLQTEFVAAGPTAAKALADFQAAAAVRRTRESEFNHRAKPAGLDLKRNLRSAEQMRALKTFTAARENLIAVNPDLGRRIASMAVKGVSTTGVKQRPARTVAAPRPPQ